MHLSSRNASAKWADAVVPGFVTVFLRGSDDELTEAPRQQLTNTSEVQALRPTVSTGHDDADDHVGQHKLQKGETELLELHGRAAKEQPRTAAMRKTARERRQTSPLSRQLGPGSHACSMMYAAVVSAILSMPSTPVCPSFLRNMRSASSAEYSIGMW